MRKGLTNMKTKKLTAMSILFALVIVLQLFASFIPMKPFTITLTLIPIVVGAAVYGRRSGALLGFAFSLVVLICCITGTDVGGNMLWSTSPVKTAVVVLLKGTAAGYVSGIVYSLLKDKNQFAAGLCSAIVCPVTNTGIFCIAMALFFRTTLKAWSGGTDLFYYTITGLVGINFLIELAINIILSPAIVRIINTRK